MSEATEPRMTLQVNNSGSWKTIVTFPHNKESFVAVCEAVETIAATAGGRQNWRITEGGADHHVVARLEAPEYVWKRA